MQHKLLDMKNRVFKHKEFLKENKITVTNISDKNIQKRINGFDEMLEDYEHTVDEDQEELGQSIIRLDNELEEDLYDLYDDQLENNDALEEETPKKVAPEEKIEQKKEVLVNTDEAILEKLMKNGYSSIKRENLRELGFKGNLEDKVHIVGKYRLTNPTFNYTFKYNITLESQH